MTAHSDMITVSRLKELLNYSPETGKFTRIKFDVPGNRHLVGNIAGSFCSNGYHNICVDGRTYKAHRLAWLYMTGKWPNHQIDHANGNRGDNRFSNLREATNSQNQQNRGIQTSNTSGHKGVHYFPRKRPWRASIRRAGKQIHLGCFATKEEAAKAYADAAKIYHGKFAKAYDL